MYSRCRHFNEGILPKLLFKTLPLLSSLSSIAAVAVTGASGLLRGFFVKLSISLLLTLLIALPRKSLAAGPQYETAYACEEKTLTIACDPGSLISLIRANYGRFSITICNDHGNVDWSVNCMSPKSLRVLHSKCTHKQNCSVLASTNMFGDPCPGTHKYLEAHYQCISAAQTSTTTARPSPPWLITNSPNLWSTSINPFTISSVGNGVAAADSSATTTTVSSMILSPSVAITTTARIGSIHQMILSPKQAAAAPSVGATKSSVKDLQSKMSTGGSSSSIIHLAGARPPIPDSASNLNVGQGPLVPFSIRGGVLQSSKEHINGSVNSSINDQALDVNQTSSIATQSTFDQHKLVPVPVPPKQASRPIGASDDNRNNSSSSALYNQELHSTQSTVLVNNNGNNNKNYENLLGGGAVDSSSIQQFCGPMTIRNLFWNVTRVGEVNVQPCPGGAFGIAKWRCILKQINQPAISSASGLSESQSSETDATAIDQKQMSLLRQHRAIWQPKTPDLTQCRSVWINNLEISVNQRDSSLISIANDLSQITSSKALYGGDMLITTKIIQTMSEKMAYDIETFPDQKQREAIITELLNGVVKTGSNLLDISHQLTWLDLSFEDQMRVATSLLTGLEDNAFLLADSIIRERTVVQKVKNILLSIRVLETRNIVGNEIFPDEKLEQWNVSDDRIELPRGALVENSEGGLVRIVFVAFDRLEAILKPSLNHLDVKFPKTQSQQNQSKTSAMQPQQPTRILNSKVISASLGKGRHIQLSQPIRLILRHLKVENVTNPVCVFWNYIDHAWSEDGCYLELTNHSHSTCMCNHLTNFAILMDATDDAATSLLTLFNHNMRILIYISIAICIIFIIVAILTLKLFNGVFVKSTRSSIYENIYVCLLIVELLFLFGIEQSETSVLCGFIAAFLHCFVLSTIAWQVFEVFQLYLTLTTEDIFLEVENSSKLIWYYLLSYGMSFTIVAISLAIDPAAYTQSDFCILMEPSTLFYTTFLTPAVVFVMGAIAYSILSAHVICQKSKATLKNKEHTRLSSIRFDLRCSIAFLVLLAIDWIFAYAYLRKAKTEDEIFTAYGYGFIVFNSFLGIYICIFHCIQNEKIRREYRKYIRQHAWLPKCLLCSKISMSSSTTHQQQHYGTVTSNKKNPITGAASLGGCGVEGIESADDDTNSFAAGIPDSERNAGEDNNLSDCTGSGCLTTQISSPAGDHRLKMFLERATSATAITAAGTLRGFNNGSGCDDAIAIGGGRISPTSSAGSTHLIFNAAAMQADSGCVSSGPSVAFGFEHQTTEKDCNISGIRIRSKQKGFSKKLLARLQDWNISRSKSSPSTASPSKQCYSAHSSIGAAPLKPDFSARYVNDDCRTAPTLKLQSAQALSQSVADCVGATTSRQLHSPQSGSISNAVPQQHHEYSYWTHESSTPGRKRLNGDAKLTHASNLLPAHKKSPRHNAPLVGDAADHDSRHYDYSGSSAAPPGCHHYCYSQSDDDDTPLRTESHLLHTVARSSAQTALNHDRWAFPFAASTPNNTTPFHAGSQQRLHKRYRPGCADAMTLPAIPPLPSDNPIGSYYGHSPTRMLDEPVYEEILSNRASDLHDDDLDDYTDEGDDYDDDEPNVHCDDRSDEGILKEDRYNRLRRVPASKEDGIEPLRQSFNRYQMKQSNIDYSTAHAKSRPAVRLDHQDSLGIIWSPYPSHSTPQLQLPKQPPLPTSQQNSQQIIGRNLSAMLDEKNTVVCYLEPLAK